MEPTQKRTRVSLYHSEMRVPEPPALAAPLCNLDTAEHRAVVDKLPLLLDSVGKLHTLVASDVPLSNSRMALHRLALFVNRYVQMLNSALMATVGTAAPDGGNESASVADLCTQARLVIADMRAATARRLVMDDYILQAALLSLDFALRDCVALDGGAHADTLLGTYAIL